MTANPTNWLHRLLAALLLLVLAACAAPNIDAKHDLRAAHDTGVVSGSITYGGPYGAYRLHLVSQATGKSFYIEHGSSQTANLSLVFKGEDPHPGLLRRGSPFAIALPVGSYELKSWKLSSGAANLESTERTGIAFTVEAGKAIYLGNYHFEETSRFGRLPTGMKVTLTDLSQRDVSVIRKAFPSLAEVPITQSLNPSVRIENLGGAAATRISIPIFVPVTR